MRVLVLTLMSVFQRPSVCDGESICWFFSTATPKKHYARRKQFALLVAPAADEQLDGMLSTRWLDISPDLASSIETAEDTPSDSLLKRKSLWTVLMVDIGAHRDWAGNRHDDAWPPWRQSANDSSSPDANGKPRLEAGAFVELSSPRNSHRPRCGCYQGSHPVKAVGFAPPRTQRKPTMSTYVAPPPAATRTLADPRYIKSPSSSESAAASVSLSALER